MKSANIHEVIRSFFLLPRVQEMASIPNPRLALGLNSSIAQAAVLSQGRDEESVTRFIEAACEATCYAVALVSKADRMMPSSFSSDVAATIKGEVSSSVTLCYQLVKRSAAVLHHLEQLHLPYSKVAVVIGSLIEVGNAVGINLVEHMNLYVKSQNQ